MKVVFLLKSFLLGLYFANSTKLHESRQFLSFDVFLFCLNFEK